MNTQPEPIIRIAPHVLRELKIKEAKAWLGKKYICHPANRVQRKTKS